MNYATVCNPKTVTHIWRTRDHRKPALCGAKIAAFVLRVKASESSKFLCAKCAEALCRK